MNRKEFIDLWKDAEKYLQNPEDINTDKLTEIVNEFSGKHASKEECAKILDDVGAVDGIEELVLGEVAIKIRDYVILEWEKISEETKVWACTKIYQSIIISFLVTRGKIDEAIEFVKNNS